MSPRSLTPEELDAAFAEIEAAAAAGTRCPMNYTGALAINSVPALARAGRIRILITGHNWRQVDILTGPHAGKSTLPDPLKRKPWKVIDAGGTRVNGKMVDYGAGQRPKPSAPRTLTRTEIERT